jgi:hypothetical protein
MAMPPDRHAAQPHPGLGGCRAQHPSTPTTQESLLGQLTFQLNSPRRRKLQVSRLLNGARGAASQLGRARTPQGCPPPRCGGQAAPLGNAEIGTPRADMAQTARDSRVAPQKKMTERQREHRGHDISTRSFPTCYFSARSTVPPLQFGLQRWGVRLHLFLAGSRGVLRGFLAFELLLRGRLPGWSGYCICSCEHQTGYRGQWRD